MRERIGEDRMPPARTVQCTFCPLTLPIGMAADWPLIVVLDKRERTADYDAMGTCPALKLVLVLFSWIYLGCC